MSDFKNINAFIFDFGNVIINIDFQLMYNKFREYLGKEYEATIERVQGGDFFKTVESSVFTAEQMTTMLNQYGASLTCEQLRESWNALLLDIPRERLELLKKLAQKYPIYLLSNTNLVHINTIFNRMEATYGYNPIKQTFTKLYLSYEIGHIKPSSKIYEYVLDDAELIAEQCLFFDDLQENLDGAAKLDMQTQLITKEYGITEFFAEHKF